MMDHKQHAVVLAAATTIGLSLGMVALTADAGQAATSNQVKGHSANQIKQGTNQIKQGTNQIKQGTNQIKNPTSQDSNQIKFWKGSNQSKFTPGTSPELNPQPEPPKPSGDKPK